MNDSSHTHREIVAAVASLKSCLRSVVLAVNPPPPTSGPSSATLPDSKIQGSVQRANDAVAKLAGLLSAVADQTLRLPLETSKRLVDVGLPDLLVQLLNACQLNAAWPAPAQAAPSPDDAAGSATGSNGSLAAAPAAEPGSTAPAALHPSWAPIQQLLQAVFSSLSVLTAVLIRACTRSHEPAMVLMQLASPAVMEAQVAYMQQLRQHAGQLQDTAGPADTAAAASLAAESLQCAPACVAAFSSIYGLLAAATDAQAGLGELRQQLITSLCSTQLLPVAADLLLLVPAAMRPEQQQTHEVQADCQAAGWSLLTLSLFVSGAGISVCPANLNPACIQPGQPLPSSMMAASIRADADELHAQAQPLDLSIAFSAAAEPSAATLQEQLLSQPVLALLQERLYHCVTELRGSYGTSSTAFTQKQKLLREEGAVQRLSLLPGRCCPADHDALHAALRALRCWRALLMSPAAPGLPVVSSFGVQLLLTLLAGVLAEPIRAGSSERESLRGRVIRVTVHCLQLMCSRLDQELLAQQLPALTAALAGVVSSAGAYWDSNKRAVKSEALPYTGQVRCVDKSTGDMMVRYTMAAQSAVDLLRQLLLTCRAYAAGPARESEAGGDKVAGAMLSAGVLPALEQLFRQLPVVSPAHVTAATFLVELLPLCLHADLSAGQLPLLVTLRKFIVKSAGIAEPDREAAMLTATQLAALLGMLATTHAHSPAAAAAGGPADTLMQHAAVQLLPALQVYVSAELKLPIPAPYSTTLSTCTVAATAAALSSPGSAAEPARTHLLPVMLATYQQLAVLACTAPQLQLGPALLSSQALPTVADILSSNYWLLPGFLAAAGISSSAGRVSSAGQALCARGSSTGAAGSSSSSSGVMFSGEHAVQLSLQVLEGLMAATAVAPQPASEGGQAGLRGSCSSDCLCAMKRSGGAEGCQIGNPKCGMHGWCCCSSPKACSDITPSVTPLVASEDGFDAAAHSADSRGAADVTGSTQLQEELPGKQQLLLVLSRLMQSRLLPELLRVVQQLSGSEGPVVSPKPGDSAAGSGGFAGGFSRPGSANGLTVNVPIRRGSLQRDPRGGASPSGVSPKAYSPLGHSAPTPAALGSSLRSQASATQAFLSAYMGETVPPTALGAGGGSSSSSASGTAAGLKLTANATSRFASSGCGPALPGTSPRADDGAYGLLRAGSSGSSIAWTAGASLLQEAGVRVAARDAASSGFGSSPSLASLALASPHAASCGDSSISPFVFSQHDRAAAAAAPGAAAAAAEVGDASQLQQRLEGLLLVVAQAVLAVAEAGMLGAERLPRRPSVASVGGIDGDSGAGGAGTPVEGFRLNGLPQPALSGTGSGPVPAGFSLLSAGVSKQLSSGASGPGGLYSSYLQSTSGPRISGSGSAPYGSVSAEDVVGSIRSCLAAAGAAAALPGSGGSGLSAKEVLGVSGSPIGAQQGSIRAVQLSPTAAADQQGSVAFMSAAGSPVGGADEAGLATEPSDVIFPVELGLSQLNISAPAVAQEGSSQALLPVVAGTHAAAPPCTPATPAVLGPLLGSAPAGAKQTPTGLLPVDVVRKLQGALAAAASLLARHSGPMESQTLCPQVILAKLAPRPVGCWNASCTNMPGASESAVASKPCPSCKVAAFCSKACEKQAWSEHTMACSRLAALAAAAAERSG